MYSEEPLLSGHPVFSSHFATPRGWPLNTGSTVFLTVWYNYIIYEKLHTVVRIIGLSEQNRLHFHTTVAISLVFSLVGHGWFIACVASTKGGGSGREVGKEEGREGGGGEEEQERGKQSKLIFVSEIC